MLGGIVSRGDGQGLPGAHQNQEALGSGDRGVEEVPLKHDVVGGMNRQNDTRYSLPWLLCTVIA